jgi:hypothetical protein
MNDDAYSLFIVIACMVTLAMPSTGQVIVAAFALALGVAAGVTPTADSHGHQEHHTHHDVAGR